MYFIYCDELGNKIINIKIKQLGLKIYSLTENQRDYIKQEYGTSNQDFLNQKLQIPG